MELEIKEMIQREINFVSQFKKFKKLKSLKTISKIMMINFKKLDNPQMFTPC